MAMTDEELRKFGNTIQLVGGVWAGEGKAYLCLFPGENADVYSGQGKVLMSPETDTEEMKVHVLNMDSPEWERFLRQTDIMETEILAKARDGSLVKAIARKSSRQVEQNVSWRVFKRDGYACRYCGKDDLPLTVDHLVRWEEGGPSIEANLLSACRKCNRTRGDQSYVEWLNSGYYRMVSAALDQGVREANVAVVPTLDSVPRKVHVHTR